MVIKFKYLAIFLLVNLLTINFVQAETFYGPADLSSKTYDNLTINGPADLKEIKTNSLNINGPLTFKGLEVKNNTSIKGPTKGKNGTFADLSIAGPLEARKMICNALEVKGPVSLTDFEVKGNAAISGPVAAQKGVFQDLTVYAPEITLKDVMVKNIVVKKLDKHHKKPTIELQGKTIVSGNITFESGDGEVTQEKGSKIEGKIMGGTLSSNELIYESMGFKLDFSMNSQPSMMINFMLIV